MLKQSDIDKIGKFLRVGMLNEWEVTEDLRIVSMASGDYAILDKTGGKIELDSLTVEQENAIKREFNLKGGESEFDENPLIPDGGERQRKKSGKSEYDTNPLIPD